MNVLQRPRLSVSTWSLHRTLGTPAFYGVDQPIPASAPHDGATSLLELPARLAQAGIHTLEICHFHLPSLDAGYLQELRASLQTAGIELFSVLIDDGDLTHPQYAERDLAWISQWIPIASQLGAQCIRVIAGKSASAPDSLKRCIQALHQLIEQAKAYNIRIMTENWFDLLSSPKPIVEVLKSMEGDVGLCLDFGNWKGPEKYAGFEIIAPLADSCHTKASFTSSPYILDTEDYTRCLEITRRAHFSGPYTLIYDGPDADEWEGLRREIEIVQQYL